jgi:hypothetical protein
MVAPLLPFSAVAAVLRSIDLQIPPCSDVRCTLDIAETGNGTVCILDPHTAHTRGQNELSMKESKKRKCALALSLVSSWKWTRNLTWLLHNARSVYSMLMTFHISRLSNSSVFRSRAASVLRTSMTLGCNYARSATGRKKGSPRIWIPLSELLLHILTLRK